MATMGSGSVPPRIGRTVGRKPLGTGVKSAPVAKVTGAGAGEVSRVRPAAAPLLSQAPAARPVPGRR